MTDRNANERTVSLPTSEVIVNIIRPKHGDFIILSIKEPMKSIELRAFRRSLWLEAQKSLAETGVYFTFLVLNTGVDIHHLSVEERLEVLHENKVVLDDDGSALNTLQGIEDDD